MTEQTESATHILPPDPITTGEAGRLVGVAAQTVGTWIKKGWLKGWQRGHWKVVSRAELLAFVRPVVVVEIPSPEESEELAKERHDRIARRRSTRRRRESVA